MFASAAITQDKANGFILRPRYFFTERRAAGVLSGEILGGVDVGWETPNGSHNPFSGRWIGWS